MIGKSDWTFERYLQELKSHISLYKSALPGTQYLKKIILDLNNEIWEFFPQECVEICGGWHPNNYLNFIDDDSYVV